MKSYLKTDFDFESPESVQILDEISLWSAPFGIKLLEHIAYKPNIKALDIGFGTGFPLLELAFRLGKQATVYGIDPWKAAINRVKEKIKFHGIDNVKILEGVAESIPLPEQTIDLITSNNGINNTENIEQVVSECSRIMKPGGQFIQTLNLSGTMIEFYNQFEQVLRNNGLDEEIKLMKEHIESKWPSLDFITNLLERNNFEIKSIKQDKFNYRFTDGTAMLNHYFIRLAFMESWIKLLPTEKVNAIFDQVESNLNSIAIEEGGLKLSIPFVLIDTVKL